MTLPTDSDLLAAARAGDDAAIEALLVRHAPSVMRFARRLCNDPVDADDVVQETLITAARGLRDVRDDAALTTWLYAVTRSFCWKKHRRSKYAPSATVEYDDNIASPPVLGPDDAAAGRELGGALDQAIASLAPMYREVLLLRDVEGLTAPEVAKALGIEVDAVKSRLHRARAVVRERLTPVLSGAGKTTACPDVVEKFSMYLEADIGQEECAAMQSHVATCASCNAACESLRRTVAACHAHGPEVPEDVQERVKRALQGVVGRTPPPRTS